MSCTFQGESIDLGEDADRILSPEEGMSSFWAGLPVGAECDLTETDAGGATFTQIVPDSVVVGGEEEEIVEFEVTNTFEVGDVAVTKVVDGAGAEFGTGPFTVELACTFNGQPITIPDGAERTLSPEDGMSATWVGLPIAAECEVAETDDGGATSTQISPDSLVIGEDEEAGFTVTNTFDLAPVSVTKVVDGEGAEFGTGPFTVELSCTFQGEAVDLGDAAQIVLVADETGAWTGLPVGAECEVTETDNGGATSVEIVPSIFPVTGDTDESDPVAVTVTNTFDLGEVGVTKVVDGEGAAEFGTGPFTMELACTFQGEDIDLGEDAERVVGAGGTGTWSGLPIGADCAVTETDDGGATSTQITPESLVIGADAEAGFTVTNTFAELPDPPAPEPPPEPGPPAPEPPPEPGPPAPGPPAPEPPGPPVDTGGTLLERDPTLLAGATLALLLMLGGTVALLRLRGRDSR